jgi:hypothetical protein
LSSAGRDAGRVYAKLNTTQTCGLQDHTYDPDQCWPSSHLASLTQQAAEGSFDALGACPGACTVPPTRLHSPGQVGACTLPLPKPTLLPPRWGPSCFLAHRTDFCRGWGGTQRRTRPRGEATEALPRGGRVKTHKTGAHTGGRSDAATTPTRPPGLGS